MLKRIGRISVAFILVAVVGLGMMTWVMNLSPLPILRGSTDEQVVQSISREEQVMLLRLGIQGIAEESVATEVFGQTLPGSGRQHFLK